MRYREFKPDLNLGRFVECFWTLENDANSLGIPTVDQSGNAGMRPERILPDGCVELILNFGSRFTEHKDNGRHEIQPLYSIVGQMTRPIMISAEGRVELIGIRFHPGGTLPFFRIPLYLLTNQVVELAALAGNFEDKMVSRVADLPTLTAKIAMLEKLLIEHPGKDVNTTSLRGLAKKIVYRGGRISVEELACDAGISSRQLERMFLRDVGVGPKMLCRILRFQQVFRAVDRADAGWAGLAADCGYYDQPHLIRDFQEFAGQTPALLFDESSDLTQLFTRKKRMSDFSNTPA